MKKAFLFVLINIICGSAFADKVIVEDTTRIIQVVTSDTSPNVPAGHTAYDVPDGFDIGGGLWRLSPVDNLTLEIPTARNIQDLKDIQDPGRVKIRELKQAIQEFESDDTDRVKLRTFLLKLQALYE